MTEVIWDLSEGTAPAGSQASPVTEDDLTLLQRSDLLAFFDAYRTGLIRSPGGRLSILTSRKRPGAIRPVATAASEPEGLYWGINPAGTVREEIRDGLDASNVVIVGTHNKLATGNAEFVVPAGDITFLYYLRLPTPASSCPIIGTVDATPMSIEILNTGVIRWYPARSSGLIATSAGAMPDTGYHLLGFKYNSASKLGQIEVDGSVVKAFASFDLSGRVGQVLQFGQYPSGGGGTIASSGYAFQGALLINSIDDVTSDLYSTLLAGRAT